MRRSSSDGVFNAITLIFLLMTAAICVCVGLLLSKTVKPPAQFQPVTPTLPQVILLPSSTPTPTDTLTPLPTNTLIPTSTRIPSKTPTPIPPTDTPTDTPLPTNTDTPVPPTATSTKTPLPTKAPPPTKTPLATVDPSKPTKTPPGFPFKIQEGSPALLANLDTAVGCSFQGVGGQVFGINGEPLMNLQVAVTSAAGFNTVATSGSNSRYGESGWVAQLDGQPNAQVYTVQLLSQQGVPLSDKVQVGFPGTCDQNLALINFIQTRPF